MSDVVRVEVRSETCMASGYCRKKAPKVFGADRDGWVVLIDPEPEGQTAHVLEAAAMCPVAAIDVFDAGGRQI